MAKTAPFRPAESGGGSRSPAREPPAHAIEGATIRTLGIGATSAAREAFGGELGGPKGPAQLGRVGWGGKWIRRMLHGF